VTAPRAVLHVNVVGTPAPQGSKRHVGNGIMIESSKKVKPWRQDVKAAALDRLAGEPPADGELSIDIGFWLARPKGHYRSGRNAQLLRDSAPRRPTTKPDLDKLIRSTLDALKDAGVYRDDSQIVTVYAQKFYADRQPPGAQILVRSHG
jgi:Holliday junction resolvase RusA-like endonuclease